MDGWNKLTVLLEQRICPHRTHLIGIKVKNLEDQLLIGGYHQLSKPYHLLNLLKVDYQEGIGRQPLLLGDPEIFDCLRTLTTDRNQLEVFLISDPGNHTIVPMEMFIIAVDGTYLLVLQSLPLEGN